MFTPGQRLSELSSAGPKGFRYVAIVAVCQSVGAINEVGCLLKTSRTSRLERSRIFRSHESAFTGDVVVQRPLEIDDTVGRELASRGLIVGTPSQLLPALDADRARDRLFAGATEGKSR